MSAGLLWGAIFHLMGLRGGGDILGRGTSLAFGRSFIEQLLHKATSLQLLP